MDTFNGHLLPALLGWQAQSGAGSAAHVCRALAGRPAGICSAFWPPCKAVLPRASSPCCLPTCFPGSALKPFSSLWLCLRVVLCPSRGDSSWHPGRCTAACKPQASNLPSSPCLDRDLLRKACEKCSRRQASVSLEKKSLIHFRLGICCFLITGKRRPPPRCWAALPRRQELSNAPSCQAVVFN